MNTVNSLHYSTFGQRLAAYIIDFFVLLPLLLLHMWVGNSSKSSALFFTIALSTAGSAYSIYCHGRYGQTIGKRAIGLRVVQLTGEPITWRMAWLRISVDLGFSCFATVGSFIALQSIKDSAYYGVSWMDQTRNLMSLRPQWCGWVANLGQVWIWSDLITMIVNPKRRAIHDFIAGTVVIASANQYKSPAMDTGQDNK